MYESCLVDAPERCKAAWNSKGSVSSALSDHLRLLPVCKVDAKQNKIKDNLLHTQDDVKYVLSHE